MQHVNSKKAQKIIKVLAKLIKEERIKQNKSQRLLADEFDIPKCMLSRLENGINEPKLISLISVCEALNIKLSSLIKKLEDECLDNFCLYEK